MGLQIHAKVFYIWLKSTKAKIKKNLYIWDKTLN